MSNEVETGGSVGVGVKTNINTELKEPSKYDVVMLNDDVTPLQFVVIVMMQVFDYSEQEGYEFAGKVHEEGSGVAGTYSKEVADTKVKEVMKMAEEFKYPLKAEKVKQ